MIEGGVVGFSPCYHLSFDLKGNFTKDRHIDILPILFCLVKISVTLLLLQKHQYTHFIMKSLVKEACLTLVSFLSKSVRSFASFLGIPTVVD